MLVAKFLVVLISLIDYADRVPCMNLQSRRNQEEARMKSAYD
jgi:hypothetical protein